MEEQTELSDFEIYYESWMHPYICSSKQQQPRRYYCGGG